MICYRDMTFCPFWIDCKEGKLCSRALTEEVEKEAEEWYGGSDAPISFFSKKPDCFEVDDGYY